MFDGVGEQAADWSRSPGRRRVDISNGDPAIDPFPSPLHLPHRRGRGKRSRRRDPFVSFSAGTVTGSPALITWVIALSDPEPVASSAKPTRGEVRRRGNFARSSFPSS